MITLLVGENDFEITRAVREIAAGFAGVAERIHGSSVQPADLPDLLLGTTLFADRRLVIIQNLSDNKSVWAALPDYTLNMSEDTHLVLVEQKPDKRTKTYKTLHKQADVKEYKLWSDRETGAAERWVAGEAGRMGIRLGSGAARLLTARSLVVSERGAVIDQWRLLSHLEKLAPLGEVGPAEVEAYIEETPVENVFALLETSLRGDGARVKEMIGRLEASEDPFRLFGLLSGQAFLLAALATSNEPSQTVAKDFSAHPFILGKLAPYGKKLGIPGIRHVASAFAEADAAMKTSASDPWLLIERALLKVAALHHSKNSAG
jgi:DNA polymerase III delta subunit